MLIPIIGENAGKIWQALHTEGEKSLSEVKAAVELDEKNVWLSLGWLAREGKIRFGKKGKQITISLTE
jgi:predicted transcriptional regulator